jgi:hypothetical protein
MRDAGEVVAVIVSISAVLGERAAWVSLEINTAEATRPQAAIFRKSGIVVRAR